jgi:hypothetical protein
MNPCKRLGSWPDDRIEADVKVVVVRERLLVHLQTSSSLSATLYRRSAPGGANWGRFLRALDFLALLQQALRTLRVSRRTPLSVWNQ